ncbi:MAG: divalent-cation tolerance protein CutA [Rhodospirillaceae bacterium]|jgi:periplasmic divalent cation tolerance protein|nr:divalent-cation tolerance protein CutA [Rhodospirillaceae bacterium]
MSVQLFYVTVSTQDEAKAIATALLNDGLIACANILGAMTSIYRWQGELAQEEEVPLILKSTTELGDRIIEKIKQIHSYESPCVVALNIENGNPEFLNWIQKEVT